MVLEMKLYILFLGRFKINRIVWVVRVVSLNICFNFNKIIGFNIYNIIIMFSVCFLYNLIFFGDILLLGFNFSNGKNLKIYLGYY